MDWKLGEFLGTLRIGLYRITKMQKFINTIIQVFG
jgi:hypothetical protein